MSSLNIFSKCPYRGNPKTRLKNLLSKNERKYISISMLKDLLDETHKLENLIDINLWVYPDYEHNFYRKLEKEYKLNLMNQEGENLFDRMMFCLNNESLQSNKTLLVGSDIPSLDSNIILDALSLLSTKDVVLGPSKDDGFYLIGIKGFFNNELFNDNENMSCKQIQKNILSKSMNFALLNELKDIDEPNDLLFL
tara:strand:+ start:72 stop:656 length:585 start_codon:yes stop_codon:yes gene_type:complete